MISGWPDRFLAPAGWRTHSFKNSKTGHRIHYGSVFPQTGAPAAAVVVFLPGLREFSEKYYETARDMVSRGYAFWCLDWAYQGRSSRMEGAPQHRHSDGFEADIDDLNKLVLDYIKPSAVHPDCGRLPLIMLGHSTGANIGLRYLAQYPKIFDTAAFTSPLLGIQGMSFVDRFLLKLLHLLPFLHTHYIPSGTDWPDRQRQNHSPLFFSSDPLRNKIHDAWMERDPVLRSGSPTIKWVMDALQSCERLKNKDLLDAIKIPLLVALSGEDRVVDNRIARHFLGKIPSALLMTIEGACHEILLERDEFRQKFLEAFDKIIEENRIATYENLKPF